MPPDRHPRPGTGPASTPARRPGHARLVMAALALIAMVLAATTTFWPVRAQDAAGDESTRPALVVGQAWARATPPNARAGGAFLTLRNGMPQAVTLIGASSPLAERVEIHQTIRDGDIMRMRPLDGGLTVPPGGAAVLQPGGAHIMLMGLTQPLAVGDTLDLTLTFDDGHALTVPVPVLPITALGPAEGTD